MISAIALCVYTLAGAHIGCTPMVKYTDDAQGSVCRQELASFFRKNSNAINTTTAKWMCFHRENEIWVQSSSIVSPLDVWDRALDRMAKQDLAK